MALDGWTFLVLSPSFAIHWGFQERHQQNKVRKLQTYENFYRFMEFEKEIQAKYAARNGKEFNSTAIAKKIALDIIKREIDARNPILKDLFLSTW